MACGFTLWLVGWKRHVVGEVLDPGASPQIFRFSHFCLFSLIICALCLFVVTPHGDKPRS